MPKTYRIKTWQEFKDQAYKNNSQCVVYIIAKSVPSRDHTGLKLILPVSGAQYIFTDSAKGNVLRRTGIPIQKNSKGNRFLTDDSVKQFLKTELAIKNLKIYSYWTA